MPEMERLELFFTQAYKTRKKIRYDEEVGDQEYSNRGPAIGYIYPYIEAMELIGSPKPPQRIKVVIEPVQ